MALPPGPKNRFPGALLLAFRRDPLAFVRRISQDYPDIASFRLGPERVALPTHPEFIRDIVVTQARRFVKGRGRQLARALLGEGLLTSEGELHRRQRRLVQPAFQRQRVAAYGPTMVAEAERQAAQWQDGSVVDMSQEMAGLTLRIVARTLFHTEVHTESDEIRSLRQVLQVPATMTMPLASLLARLPLPANRRFRQARARLNAMLYRLIDERRASGEDHGDILSMLLRAQDDEGDGHGMSATQVRDEMLTLLLAGHETTATALTWTWYVLSQHPQVEATLHEELARVLGGRLPGVDDLPDLPYSRMVLTEVMRLYPPAWLMTRRTLDTYAIGDYELPPNTFIMISPYVMHHQARYFTDPERFDPQRWTAERQALLPRFAYFPFGGGPRQCIGEGFAWQEALLLLATLAQQWQMRLLPGHPVVPLALVTLRPKYGLRMALQRRSPTAPGAPRP